MATTFTIDEHKNLIGNEYASINQAYSNAAFLDCYSHYSTKITIYMNGSVGCNPYYMNYNNDPRIYVDSQRINIIRNTNTKKTISFRFGSESSNLRIMWVYYVYGSSSLMFTKVNEESVSSYVVSLSDPGMMVILPSPYLIL